MFYWHVAKVSYRAKLPLDEILHINLDWYLTVNAQRQSHVEVRIWCLRAALVIEGEQVQDTGISIFTVKQ